MGRPALPSRRRVSLRRALPPRESEDESEGEREKENEVAVVSSTRPVSESPHVFDRAVASSSVARSGLPPPTPPSFRRASDFPSDDDRATPTSSAAVSNDAAPTLRLEVVSGGAWGSAVTAPPGTEALTIGRSDARDLVVNDAEVSSSHAEVRFTWLSDFLGESDGGANGGGVRRRRRDRHGIGSVSSDESEEASRGGTGAGEWRVADLGSTNGTFLNGVAIGGGARRSSGPGQWRALRDGDEIRLGERSESPKIRVGVGGEKMPQPDANRTQTARVTLRGSREPRASPAHGRPRAGGVSASRQSSRRVVRRVRRTRGARGGVARASHLPRGGGAASRRKRPWARGRGGGASGRVPGDGRDDGVRVRGGAAAATLVWRCPETDRSIARRRRTSGTAGCPSGGYAPVDETARSSRARTS